MGVIQYRRGEQFDRVIVSKNEDPRASNMVVRLNTHTFKISNSTSPTPNVTDPKPLAKRSLAEILNRAIEASAKNSPNTAVRDIFKPTHNPFNRPRAEAEQLLPEISDKAKPGFLANPLKYLFIGFIVYQILRGLFSR